jgi:hypothetical protein
MLAMLLNAPDKSGRATPGYLAENVFPVVVTVAERSSAGEHMGQLARRSLRLLSLRTDGRTITSPHLGQARASAQVLQRGALDRADLPNRWDFAIRPVERAI